MVRLRRCCLLLGIVAPLCVTGCSQRAPEGSPGVLEDKSLEPYRCELLDLAFGAASAIPASPHIKDRSLTQENVVTACLTLGQPQRALRYIEQIDNWRRGAAYADLAFYCAQHGAMKKDVERYLDKAAEAAKEAEDWRRDRINVKIAGTLAYLGQTGQADQLTVGVAPAETGKVTAVRAMISDDEAFDAQMRRIDELIASGQFDIVKNALEASVRLFDRFYTDQTQRGRVEEKIKTTWKPMPISIRIDLLMEMTISALDHADQAKALALVNEAQALVDAYTWPLEHRIPMTAKLIALRFRAGDEQRARSDADDLRRLFDTEGKKIVNIYRAGALRPLAETYQVMGETAVTLAVYKQAVEAGVENPNSRPRAEDLAATCCSLAVHAVEPDAELMARIREIRAGLGDPW
jgi:tetratricopeptide (TPR) repeat protein